MNFTLTTFKPLCRVGDKVSNFRVWGFNYMFCSR